MTVATEQQPKNVLVSSDIFFGEEGLTTQTDKTEQPPVAVEDVSQTTESLAEGESDWWTEESSQAATEAASADPLANASFLNEIAKEYEIEATTVQEFKEKLDAKIQAALNVEAPSDYQALQNYMGLSDEDKIWVYFNEKRESDPLFEMSDEQIEDKIEELRDSNRIASIAAQVSKTKEAQLAQLEAAIQREKADYEKEVIQSKQNIREAIGKFAPIEGVSLSAAQSAELQRFVLDAEFANKVLSNPEAIAAAAFFTHPMGKQFIKKLQADAAKRGASNVYKALETSTPKVGTDAPVGGGTGKSRLVSSDEFYNN